MIRGKTPYHPFTHPELLPSHGDLHISFGIRDQLAGQIERDTFDFAGKGESNAVFFLPIIAAAPAPPTPRSPCLTIATARRRCGDGQPRQQAPGDSVHVQPRQLGQGDSVHLQPRQLGQGDSVHVQPRQLGQGDSVLFYLP